ncbi:hypothetical protein [Bacillus toyonensis]|uniref:hypothetical protein n=1 Tax=Bacillus toyonensis TaxID=155322 RepID=UPI002E1EF9EA|nr:hypothetical protein [Bacillus toyonensis]
MNPLEKIVDVEGMYFKIIKQIETEIPYLQYAPSSVFLEFNKISSGGKKDLTESLELRLGFNSFKIEHNKLPEPLQKEISNLLEAFKEYNMDITVEYYFDDEITFSYEHHLDYKGSDIQVEDIMTHFPVEGERIELFLIFASQEVVAATYRDLMRSIDKKFNEMKKEIKTESLRTEVTKKIRKLIDVAVEKEFSENKIVC